MTLHDKGLVLGIVALVIGSASAAAQERASGEALYRQYCGACHQPDGRGVPGFFPPLANNPLVATEEPEQIQEYLGRIIFGHHGALTVEGKTYIGTMPPIGYWGRVNDGELLALINYQRRAWGHSARPVSALELAKARERASEEKKPD